MTVSPDPPTDDIAAPGTALTDLGLVAGDHVRWRDRPGGRWRMGRVEARERDGSVAVRDGRGASRALRHDRLEVATRGTRGAATWESVAERAGRTEQLGLWGRAPTAPPSARPR